MQDADVILLHGLGRTLWVMSKMAKHLAQQGYTVHNLDYRSTRYPIEELAQRIYQRITAMRIDGARRPLHFVAHSLGSIITHWMIKHYHPQNLGRIVAIGPPYHGSAIIDHLQHYRWYHWLHGPAAIELTTEAHGICHRLGAIDYELGVIAGDRCFFTDWFFAKYWLQQPNDGKVEVASTHITGCRDHIVLPVDHTFEPKYRQVILQTTYFLHHGRFERV